MASEISLQERYAPKNICFGCGPANDRGLRIRSFESGDDFVAEWKPEEHHQAFPGVLNGGVFRALLDCHPNLAAALVVAACGPRPGETRTIVTTETVEAPPPPPRPGDPLPADPLVKYNVDLLNSYRAKHGRSPLLYDAKISAFALAGSKQLASD